jgi:hypothetical protein
MSAESSAINAAASQRRSDGRERPYRALRTLAKLYIVLAPLVLVSMTLIGVVALANDAPLSAKLGSGLGACLVGAVYFIIMRSIAQAIYLLFDVANNVSEIRSVSEFLKNKTVQQLKAAANP